MSDKRMKIRITKNNYTTGSLDFEIFDPEEDTYGVKNAFSDENRLLAFTSATLPTRQYAEDLMRTLLSTYDRMIRMVGVEIVFVGTLADAACLRQALEKLRHPEQDVTFVADCKWDPADVLDQLDSLVGAYNAALSRLAEAPVTARASKLVTGTFAMRPITAAARSNNAKAVLREAETIRGGLLDALALTGKTIGSVGNKVRNIEDSMRIYETQRANMAVGFCSRFETVFKTRQTAVAGAYEAALRLQLDRYRERMQRDMSREDLTAFCLDFLSGFRQQAEASIAEVLKRSFFEVWDGLAPEVSRDICRLTEAERCTLLRPGAALSVSVKLPETGADELEELLFDGKKLSKTLRSAVSYNAKSKKYTVDSEKWEALYADKNAWIRRQYCEACFYGALSTFKGRICLDAYRHGVQTTPDAKKARLLKEASDCRAWIGLLKTFSAEITDLDRELEQTVEAAKEGGASE